MNRLLCLGLVLLAPLPAIAQVAPELIWDPAKKARCEVPEELQQMAYMKARALIGTYVKRSGDDWQATYHPGGSETWVQMGGLHFNYIKKGQIYPVDERNGIDLWLDEFGLVMRKTMIATYTESLRVEWEWVVTDLDQDPGPPLP